MKLFNRIVVTLLLLALIPIVTVGLIVPREAVELLGDRLAEIEDGLPESMSAGRLVVSGALALLIDGLLVFLLYLQVRRKSAGIVPVRLAEGGKAQIAVSSIVNRLGYHVDRLPGVLDTKIEVAGRRRGVEVQLDVETTADVYLPTIIEEVNTVTRQVVEEEMGLKLKGKPKINLSTVPYPSEPVAPGSVEEPPPFEIEEPALPIAEGEVIVGEGYGLEESIADTA
jgi:hypothetical protein